MVKKGDKDHEVHRAVYKFLHDLSESYNLKDRDGRAIDICPADIKLNTNGGSLMLKVEVDGGEVSLEHWNFEEFKKHKTY